jgi:hypothetical protein
MSIIGKVDSLWPPQLAREAPVRLRSGQAVRSPEQLCRQFELVAGDAA